MKTILRHVFLFGLAFIATIGLLGEPSTEAAIIPSRLIGAASVAVLAALWRRWASVDPIIAMFSQWEEEER